MKFLLIVFAFAISLASISPPTSASNIFADDDQRGVKEAILAFETLVALHDVDNELPTQLSQISLMTVSRVVQIMEPLLQNFEPLMPKFFEFASSAKDADAVANFATFAKDETGLTMSELFALIQQTRWRVEEVIEEAAVEIEDFIAHSPFIQSRSSGTQLVEAGLLILTKMAARPRDQLALFGTYLGHIDPSVVEINEDNDHHKPRSGTGAVIDVRLVAGEIRELYQYQNNLEDEELTFQLRNILDRASISATIIFNMVNQILKPLPPSVLDKWQPIELDSHEDESKTLNFTKTVEQLEDSRHQIEHLVSSTASAIEVLNQSEATQMVSSVFFVVVQKIHDKVLKLEHHLKEEEEEHAGGMNNKKFFEQLNKIVTANGVALAKMKEGMEHFYDGTVAGPSIISLFEKTEMEAVKISETFLKVGSTPKPNFSQIFQFSKDYESKWTRLVESTLDGIDEILADEMDIILAQVEKVVTEFEEEVQRGLDQLKILMRQTQNVRSMTCDNETCGFES